MRVPKLWLMGPHYIVYMAAPFVIVHQDNIYLNINRRGQSVSALSV